ncbi:MAG: aldo/keto reductase [Limnochordia bacterium]|jgi:L-glyceraldehyde 3-phosphate reductase
MVYTPAQQRYETMEYRRCGNSGLKLPIISLGLWQNFGWKQSRENARDIIMTAFDRGITHFDLANNYGPPPGAAEETFGRILKSDLRPWRDELIISTKAGYLMWPGPYGDRGSRKYLLASLDQSLMRMGLEYVDIFYHHRMDPETPLEESMGALASAIQQGKALYVGLSNYDAPTTRRAVRILADMGIHCLIHQPRYNMLDRTIEPELLPTLEEEGVGCIPYVPLAQGLLTNRYLNDIPVDSRAAGPSPTLSAERITPQLVQKLNALNAVAQERGQTLAQMALSWILKDNRITSALIGVSKPAQVIENVAVVGHIRFSDDELTRIDAILQAE